MTDSIENPSSPEQEMATIDSLVSQLKEWETRNSENPKVVKALQITHQIIDGPYENFLKARGVLITYHGSMLYNDPRHLDLDLVFTAREEKVMKGVRVLEEQLQDNFERVQDWPESGDNQGLCDTNFSTFSMESFIDEVNDHETGNIPYDWENDTTDLEASYFLTSKCLYSDQEDQLAKNKEQTLELLKRAPMLRKGVIDVLEHTLQNRIDRSNTPVE